MHNSTREVFGHKLIVSQEPSDSKSNRSHVDIILRFCFHSFDEILSSIDSSKMIGKISWSLELQPVVIPQTQPVGSSVTDRHFSPDSA